MVEPGTGTKEPNAIGKLYLSTSYGLQRTVPVRCLGQLLPYPSCGHSSSQSSSAAEVTAIETIAIVVELILAEADTVVGVVEAKVIALAKAEVIVERAAVATVVAVPAATQQQQQRSYD